MVFVAVELVIVGFGHAARHFGPLIVRPIGKPLLDEFQRLDIIGGGEAAGTVEGQERIEAARAGPRRLTSSARISSISLRASSP